MSNATIGGNYPDFIQIVCVDAAKMPMDVLEWCIKEEIQTHSQNDIALVPAKRNPFAKWLKSMGYKFKEDEDWIGIFAT